MTECNRRGYVRETRGRPRRASIGALQPMHNCWKSHLGRGQIGTDGGDSLTEQTVTALQKIDNLLSEAGSSKSDLVRVTVLLLDMSDFSEFNDIYGSWLAGTVLPARAAYAVKELPGGAKVEIVAEAFLGSGEK